MHRFGGLKLFGEWSRQTKMGGPGHWGHPQGHVARLATNKGEKGACAFSSSLHFSSLEDITLNTIYIYYINIFLYIVIRRRDYELPSELTWSCIEAAVLMGVLLRRRCRRRSYDSSSGSESEEISS